MSATKTKFILTTKGDPELGDFGQTAEVVTEVPERPGYLEATKAELQATFAKMWNDPLVTVEIAPIVITTTHGIRTNPTDLSRGSLNITVHVNGEAGQSAPFLSGPLADIEEFVAGKIDLAEVRRRWRFR